MPATTAILAGVFISSLGINTHIHSAKFGYENLAVVSGNLKYLGVHNVRDSAQSASDIQAWTQVASAAGVKFDDYMPEGSPADMHNALALVDDLARASLLNFIEGGNEEDDPYAKSLGNSIAFAVGFQQEVSQAGHRLGLPVINLSFGSGWTAANNWHGNYDKAGNLAAECDYANAHVYPASGPGQPAKTVLRLTPVAQLAATGKPTIITEVGWKASNTDPNAMANYVLNAAMDATLNGNPLTYYYALYDDKSGGFGLMNADGSPKPAGAALHNITMLLRDAGPPPKTAGSLSYDLRDTKGGEKSLVLEKSDGTYWIAIWDETDSPHTITTSLGSAAATAQIFDPIAGTAPVSTFSHQQQVAVPLTDHVMLLKVSN